MRRGLEILTVVCERGPVTAEKLAASVGIPLSTVYRYVGMLRSLGYLDLVDGHFDLGVRMLDLVRRTDVNKVLARLAFPLLVELVGRIGETALLTVPAGWAAICIESVEPRRPGRLSYRRGAALPLHAGASAKPLLAHLPGSALQEYLRYGGLTRFTTGVASAETLYRQLDQIRQTGVCVTVGEVDPDSVGIGVPVFVDDHVAACLSVAGPRSRLPDYTIREAASVLRTMAIRLSKRWAVEGELPSEQAKTLAASPAFRQVQQGPKR
jgi:DNA-binding IclR family transcriptional regulator